MTTTTAEQLKRIDESDVTDQFDSLNELLASLELPDNPAIKITSITHEGHEKVRTIIGGKNRSNSMAEPA
jgi:hypothetical protein